MFNKDKKITEDFKRIKIKLRLKFFDCILKHYFFPFSSLKKIFI